MALLFLFIGSVGAQAQSGWEYLDDSPERLIGLLDLPDIVGSGCDLQAQRATARVFNTASQNGRQLGMLYFHDEGNAGCRLMIETGDSVKENVPTLESGYEIGAAWKAQLDRGVAIKYLGSRRAGSDLWIHVQVATDRCGQMVDGVPQAVMGWIPAYRSNRSPNVWFHSRGC